MNELNEITIEILDLIRSNLKNEEIKIELTHYHESDIADALPNLSKDERKKLYSILGQEMTSEIFTYLDDVDEYIKELNDEEAADLIENMDADDAIDVLEELDSDDRKSIVSKMDDESVSDIKLIASYDEDEIGSKMTTNFIEIPKNSTIKQAMRLVIKEASDNDNVNLIYVTENDGTFYGCIELKDLIVSRADTDINTIIHTSYPYLLDTTKIDECINDLKEYDLPMVPILNKDNKLIGVITSSDIIETVEEEMGEDYAKLAGMSEEADIDEPYKTSFKKRLPWLLLLLFLGLTVSLVISQFEAIIAIIPMVVFFQSIVLDMAGNVGTQSLAVTIRFLASDEINRKNAWKMIFKEVKIGFSNGLVVGIVSSIVVFLFLLIKNQPITGDTFQILDATYLSLSVFVSLVVALTLASFVGVVTPILLKKLKFDPAVASGPLITTVDDLVAVITYYGLAMLFFSFVF